PRAQAAREADERRHGLRRRIREQLAGDLAQLGGDLRGELLPLGQPGGGLVERDVLVFLGFCLGGCGESQDRCGEDACGHGRGVYPGTFSNVTLAPSAVPCARANPALTSSTYCDGLPTLRVSRVSGGASANTPATVMSARMKIMSREMRVFFIQKPCTSSVSNRNSMPSPVGRFCTNSRPRWRCASVRATRTRTRASPTRTAEVNAGRLSAAAASSCAAAGGAGAAGSAGLHEGNAMRIARAISG